MFKNYFKGWYFKCDTGDKTIAFIPAYHIAQNQRAASLQIITDSETFNLPIHALKYHESPLSAKADNCLFSESGVRLSIHREQLEAHGKLVFSDLTPIKYDIMGPFKFVPFMQCRHSVYSMNHKIDGQITINGERYVFRGGTGYIEGDRGSSFPKRYIWTQCCFGKVSVMLSVADIPLSGFHFNGIIGVVMSSEKEYRIATYLGAKIHRVSDNAVTVKQGELQLTVKLIKSDPHPLCAPDCGKMSRTIHESASCTAYYHFSCSGRTLCEFISDRASFEFEFLPCKL